MNVAIVNSEGVVISVVAVDDADEFNPGEDFVAVADVANEAFAGCAWSPDVGFVSPQSEISPDEVLASVKSGLRDAVDAAAEQQRLRYITGGAGQAMTYAQKAEEARLCLTAIAPEPETYPLLAAEIGITASTLVGVAQVVAAANAQWLQIGAAIEAARLATKKTIAEAETIEQAQTAASAVVWP